MVFTNFSVVSGYGKGVVVSAGRDSHMIASEAISNAPAKVLKEDRVSRGLRHLAMYMASVSGLGALIYVVVWACWLRVSFPWSWTSVASSALHVAAVGVPVGLQLSLTSGIYIVRRKLRRHTDLIVKNILSVLSLSGIDVVLVDKTGTLTRNSLEIASVFYAQQDVDIDSCFQTPDVSSSGHKTALEQFLDLCDFVSRDHVHSVATNQIEKTLFDFSRRNRPWSKKLVEECKLVDEIEFNSSIK